MELGARKIDELYLRWLFACGTLLLFGCSLLPECGGQTTQIGGPTTPSGGQTTQIGGPTTPSGGQTTQIGGPTTPSGGQTAPIGGPTTPNGGPTTPSGGPTTPSGGQTMSMPRGRPFRPTPSGGPIRPTPSSDSTTSSGINFCRWVYFESTLILDGDPQPSVATMSQCQSLCQVSASCKGFDWSLSKVSDSHCFLHTHQNGKQYADNVYHYDKGFCADCNWHRMDGWKIDGGTVNPATDLNRCQNACLISDDCKSIDWMNGDTPGQQCYLLTKHLGAFAASNVTHFSLLCHTGGVCSWSAPKRDMGIADGQLIPALTLDDCKLTCQSTGYCESFDWNRDLIPGQQCYLNHMKNRGLISTSIGSDHYDLIGNCLDEHCTWTKVDKTKIVGVEQNTATDLGSCKRACLSLNGCRGVDWASPGTQVNRCYLQTTQSIKEATDYVTHYDLNC